MKKILLIFGFFFVAANAEAKITILACEPEWYSLARQIVQDKADINLAVSANQDAKNIEVKAPLIAKARTARMFFCNGGDLEARWLTTLINKSYNLKAVTDKESVLFAYDYADKIGGIDEPDFTMVGKKKFYKNGVRVHLNPNNITKIAAEFTKRVKKYDPINADFYQQSYENFVKNWEVSIKKWEGRASALKGMTFIANDNSWSYLGNWLGFKIITLSDQENGDKPDVVNLNDLAKSLKTAPAEAIIFAGWENKKSLFWVRDTAKIRLVSLPFTVGGAANSINLFMMFDTTVNSLLTDCSKGTCVTLSEPENKKIKFK